MKITGKFPGLNLNRLVAPNSVFVFDASHTMQAAETKLRGTVVYGDARGIHAPESDLAKSGNLLNANTTGGTFTHFDATAGHKQRKRSWDHIPNQNVTLEDVGTPTISSSTSRVPVKVTTATPAKKPTPDVDVGVDL